MHEATPETNIAKPVPHVREDEAVIGADEHPVGKGTQKRTKVPFLGHGYSHMDWVRLTNGPTDLAGTKGNILRVTKEELMKHRSEEDVWMVFRGKVYNITPYLKFHPGGIPEIMKAAGRDGTRLFEYKHPWVNAESMLAKCFVGYYVG